MSKEIVFAEVYQVLLNTQKDVVDRIPQNILMYIEEQRDKRYSINIDNTKDLLSQNISNEAFGIIAKLYRDYICSDGEREKIKEDEENYENKLNSVYSELYSKGTNDIFKDLENTQNIKNEDLPYSTEKNENWFEKILRRIKNMFKKEVHNG